MPRIMSIARSSPTRSSMVRCSDTSARCADSAVSVAIWRASPFPGFVGVPGSPGRPWRRPPGSPAGRRCNHSNGAKGTPCARGYAEAAMDPSGWETEPRRGRPDRRQALRRLRWRLLGAWQWPAFVALTLADGVVLPKLPFYEGGPGSVFAGVLLSGFANLFAVAVLAPLAARALRRRRPDLPRLVARDYAGTALIAALFLAMLGGGLAHRPAAAA